MNFGLIAGLATLVGLYLSALVLNHGLWNAIDALALRLHKSAIHGRARQEREADAIADKWEQARKKCAHGLPVHKAEAVWHTPAYRESMEVWGAGGASVPITVGGEGGKANGGNGKTNGTGAGVV